MINNELDYNPPKIKIYQIVLITVSIGFLLNFIINYRFIFSLKAIIEIIVNASLMGTAIWKGSEWITSKMKRKYPWLEHPIKRIFFNSIYLFLYNLTVVMIINTIYRFIIYDYSVIQMKHDFFLAVIIVIALTIGINMAIYSAIFYRNWRYNALNEEILKREQLALQFESLKNQVNPELLFSSLKVLTRMVHEDADLAARFIKNLSEIYRYSLEQKNVEIIEISDELNALDNYLNVQKVRFGSHLLIIKEIEFKSKAYIIPLSTQIIIDNLLQQSSINNDILIEIKLSNDNNVLIVNISNTTIPSTDKKIDNIKERYKQFTNKELTIETSGNNCTIKFPIITKE